jgi:hypothetical protein
MLGLAALLDLLQKLSTAPKLSCKLQEGVTGQVPTMIQNGR